MWTRLGPFFAAALAALACFALSATQALATHVQCGDVITQDTTLDSDLIDCPGDGLVIGADNITLDLNGHLIDGDGTRPADPCGIDVGVVNGEELLFGCPPPPAGHDGVTIENGVVHEFDSGVSLGAASHGAVRGMTMTHAGIDLLGGSADNLVTQNSVSDGGGISLREAGPDNRIEQNSAFDNRSVFTGAGIYISGSADGNRIERNLLAGNDVGLFASDAFGVTLIKDNAVLDNNVGIWLIESQNKRIEGNHVLRSNGTPDRFTPGGDGISVDDRGNEIVGNISSRNRGDGIEVTVHADNTVARNHANRNGDLGIEAVMGVSGSGNRAKHNGNPAQCVPDYLCSTTGKPWRIHTSGRL
jgi:parallel beta-helix repeat protein